MSRSLHVLAVAGLAILLVACPSTPKPPESTAAAPTFSPAGGSYTETQTVTISSSTEAAEIRYTTDSSEPTATTGTVYAGPISVSSTTTIKAIATRKGFKDSEVATATFTITAPAAAAPQQPEVSPVTDEEVAAAQNAIARAREVDADYYDPQNFDEARRLLDSALAARNGDPASARSQLEQAVEKANLSFDNSVSRLADDLGARMAALRQKLLDLQADKFTADEFQRSTAGIDEAMGLFDKKDYAQARARAWQALREMADLRDRLETRLQSLATLRYNVEQDMKEAESSNAYAFAPARKDTVTTLYLQGLQGQQEYKLDQAEESYGAALEAVKELLRIARESRDVRMADEKAKTEAKRAQVMKALEEASRLTIVTEDGTVVQPKNWTEDDLQKEVESTEDLLVQARQLWSLGLKDEAAGNYGKASDSFDEALRFIDVYSSYAVKGVYTVRLIPGRRDCLWRIAESKDVYGDPYQWPRIWQRNRKLIQNPDLIQPGWQLVIPPL